MQALTTKLCCVAGKALDSTSVVYLCVLQLKASREEAGHLVVEASGVFVCPVPVLLALAEHRYSKRYYRQAQVAP